MDRNRALIEIMHAIRKYGVTEPRLWHDIEQDLRRLKDNTLKELGFSILNMKEGYNYGKKET